MQHDASTDASRQAVGNPDLPAQNEPFVNGPLQGLSGRLPDEAKCVKSVLSNVYPEFEKDARKGVDSGKAWHTERDEQQAPLLGLECPEEGINLHAGHGFSFLGFRQAAMGFPAGRRGPPGGKGGEETLLNMLPDISKKSHHNRGEGISREMGGGSTVIPRRPDVVQNQAATSQASPSVLEEATYIPPRVEKPTRYSTGPVKESQRSNSGPALVSRAFRGNSFELLPSLGRLSKQQSQGEVKSEMQPNGRIHSKDEAPALPRALAHNNTCSETHSKQNGVEYAPERQANGRYLSDGNASASTADFQPEKEQQVMHWCSRFNPSFNACTLRNPGLLYFTQTLIGHNMPWRCWAVMRSRCKNCLKLAMHCRHYL